VAPLIILVVAFCVFRALGWAGVTHFHSAQESLQPALAVMFLFTAWAHFGKMRGDLVKMVPAVFGNASMWVTLTGLLEFLGAAGLLLRPTSKPAAYALIALLLAMFPANVYAARHALKIGSRQAMRLDLRILIQVVFIAALLASTFAF
jgi:uncharacterized membrane protein